MLYKVLPPPQSMIEIMWNFQELKTEESRIYIETIITSLDTNGKLFLEYRPRDISRVIHETHEMFKREVEKSAVNLRDVSRFKILYPWFMNNMPKAPVSDYDRQHWIDYDYNYKMDKGERAFILSICFCYYMRLGTFEKRKEYLKMVEGMMGYKAEYM
jgi:hypothetical protein